MPKWLNAILGGVEIAAGAISHAVAPGNPLGFKLIALGIGTELQGIGQLLAKGPVKGGVTTERNPTYPREIGYGLVNTGGSGTFINTFGKNNKWQDVIVDLFDCPCNGVVEVLFDKQQVQFDTTAIVSGAPTSTYPFINAGMTFNGLQQNGLGIYFVQRTNNIVTLVTKGSSSGSPVGGDIPLLSPGDNVFVDSVPSGDGHNPGDSTINGRYKCQTVQHFTFSDPRWPGSGTQGAGTYVVITYLCGGLNTGAISLTGHISTQWPQYGSRVWMEVMTGKQQLGTTFASLANTSGVESGTPNPSDPHGGFTPGNTITYQNQTSDPVELPPWTNFCSMVGCTAVFLRFNFDSQWMPFIPQISFVVQGKNNIWDPRIGPYNGAGTVSLSSAGSGYEVGDVLTVTVGTNHASITVLAIDGSTTGPITRWYVSAPGGGATGYTIGESLSVTGGHGSGAGFTVLTLAPSTGTAVYTSNAALCTADFCCDQIYGYKMQYGRPGGINITALVTAATICDQQVAVAAGGYEDRYTINGKYSSAMLRGEILKDMLNAMAGRITFQNGQYNLVAGAWLGSIGAEWVNSAVYGLGQYSVWDGIAYQSLISSNTSNQPDTHPSDWKAISTQGPPLGAMLPIEWSGPSITELYNGVKGTYIFPGNNWEPSDFPPYCMDSTHGYTLGVTWSSAVTFGNGQFTVYDGVGYQSLQASNLNHVPGASGSGSWWAQSYQDVLVTSDGGDRRWLDLKLPYTTSSATAQRLAKIALTRLRPFGPPAGTGVLRYNMFGYQFTALDVITVTFPPWSAFGWTNKNLEIITSRFNPNPQSLSTEFAVIETDESIYDWNPATEELTPAGYVQPFIGTSANQSVGAPTGVALESDVTTAYIDMTGVARSRILVTWTPPADALVLSGGHIECQYQLVSSPPSSWVSVPSVDPNSTRLYIGGLIDGQSYYVQIRGVDINGMPSEWVAAGPTVVAGSAYLALGPPATVAFSLSTDGQGNLLINSVSVANADGSPCTSATSITYDVYFVDGTQQAVTEISDTSFGPTVTAMDFIGVPPQVGYAVIGYGNPSAEIIYVESVSGSTATVERGVFGTTAGTWNALLTTFSAVNSSWNLEFNVGTGLAIFPGMLAANSYVPTNSFVTEYNSSTGLVRITSPLSTAPVIGNAVVFLNQVSPLNVTERTVTVAPGYFGGPSQPTLFDYMTIESVCVMFVYMKAHNSYSPTGTPSSGTDSPWFQTNGEYPQANLIAANPIFTHGGYRLNWAYPQLPAGDSVDVFEEVNAPESQDFGSVRASYANGPSNPIATPVPITDVRLTNQQASGSLTFSGPVDEFAEIFVSASTGGTGVAASVFIPSMHGITGSSSLSDVATAMATFLNSDAVFGAYYTCVASSAVVNIFDVTNQGGTLNCLIISSMSCAPAGFTSVLGILTGSFYSAAYKDSAGSFLGSATPFNAQESTGPTGGYAAVLLGNIAISPDSRVDTIELYRAADGTPYGLLSPLYLIGSVANTSADLSGFTAFSDTMAESTLLIQSVYPGPTQPASAGDVILLISQNGNPWMQLRIPENDYTSNVVPGTAIRGLGIGAKLEVEAINGAGGPIDLSLVMA